MSIDLSESKYKYDQTEDRPIYLTLIAIILVILFVLFQNAGIGYNSNGTYSLATILWVNIGIRIVLVGIAVDAASRLNRSTREFGIYTALFPAITLFIMGFLRKLTYPDNYYKLSDAQMSKINRRYALKLCNQGSYELANDFINEAWKLGKSSSNNYYVKSLIEYRLGNYEKALDVLNRSKDSGKPNDLHHIRDKVYNLLKEKGITNEDIHKEEEE